MNRDDIKHGMQVLASDGTLVGTVDGTEGGDIKLQRSDSADGRHHFVPLDFVERVDEHVHLRVAGDAALGGGASSSGTAAGTGALGAGAAAAAHRTGRADDADRKGMGWLPWVLGGLALLALILALRGCNDGSDDDRATVADSAAAPADSAAVGGAGAAMTDDDGALMTRDVEAYLAGTEATPRTFGFNNVFFDTGSAAIRPDDQKEVAALAKVLAKRPGLKADIVGMADAQGTSEANTKLAMDRAKAVIKLLTANGVPAAALTASSAGEGNTAGADQGSRRVDLIVNAR